MSRSDFSNKLLHHRATERIVVLCHHYEGPGAADDVVTVVFLDASRRIGVSRIWGRFNVGQNHKAVDEDAFGNCLITEKSHVRTSIVAALPPPINPNPFGLHRRPPA